MQSLLIEFMSSYALTKSLTSLALCSCVFISDTCESLSLNRDHSAAPACGMLLPASIPCRNQQCVKMDCVCFFLYPLLNTFFFLKYSKDLFSSCFFGMSFLLPEGRVKGSKPLPSCSWSGKLARACGDKGTATKRVGRDPWSPLPVGAAVLELQQVGKQIN